MMLDGKSKIAIAASIFWMAMATFVILGTHGESVAKANAAVATPEVTTEWMAHPAHLSDDFVTVPAPSQC